MDELTAQLTAIKAVITDAGPYVVLVILAFLYLRYTRQREREQNGIAIVQAETQNAMAANQATLISQNADTQRTLAQITTLLGETRKAIQDTQCVIEDNQRVILDNQKVLRERTAAALREAAALDSFSERFGIEMTGLKTHMTDELGSVKTAMNAAGEMMTARAEATDAQLRSIQAGVEYTGKVATETKQVIDTLPADTTRVVLEIGERAMSDHARIQQTIDALAHKLDELPAYVARGIAPFVEDLRREIKAIAAAAPIREVALALPEGVPLAERSAGQVAAAELRAELGRAEGAA